MWHNGEAALTKLVEKYLKFYHERRTYYEKLLQDGVYIERDGVNDTAAATINGALKAHLEERIAFWTKCFDKLTDYIKSPLVDSRYEDIAQLTVLTLVRLTPKLFYNVCDKLWHTDFKTPHAINIFELEGREWESVYLCLCGVNLGGDYVRIFLYICVVGFFDVSLI